MVVGGVAVVERWVLHGDGTFTFERQICGGEVAAQPGSWLLSGDATAVDLLDEDGALSFDYGGGGAYSLALREGAVCPVQLRNVVDDSTTVIYDLEAGALCLTDNCFGFLEDAVAPCEPPDVPMVCG